MAILIWLGKNLGLILGIVELVVTALVNIIAQILKVIMGIINILQPSRQKDALVNFAAKLENVSKWIEDVFTKIKAWLYSFGAK